MEVVIKLLPDQSGRVRVHWFQRDDAGPITASKAVVRPTRIGPLRLGGGKGRIACQPAQDKLDVRGPGGVWYPLLHTDDARAANCPECLATEAAQAWLKNQEGVVTSPNG